MTTESRVGTNFFSKKTSTLSIAFTDEVGNAVFAKCVGTPPTTANVFAVACIILEDNGAVYENGGTVATPVWNLLGTVAPGTVGTAQLANGGVTLLKLAPGITPSHIVVFAGNANNGGGSATVAITVTGLAATDIVFACVQASTNPSYVVKAVPTLNTLTVTLSADPGAATVISYQALRAAS